MKASQQQSDWQNRIENWLYRVAAALVIGVVAACVFKWPVGISILGVEIQPPFHQWCKHFAVSEPSTSVPHGGDKAVSEETPSSGYSNHSLTPTVTYLPPLVVMTPVLKTYEWHIYCRTESSSINLGRHGFRVVGEEVFVKVDDPAPLSDRRGKIYAVLNPKEKINFEVEYKVGVHGSEASVLGAQMWLGVISLCKCVNEPIGNYFIFQKRSGEKYAIIGNGSKTFALKPVQGKVNGQIMVLEKGWVSFFLRDSNNNILQKVLLLPSDCGERYGLLIGYQVQAGYSLTGMVRFH